MLDSSSLPGVRHIMAMTLSLHRCKICGARWLLWPDEIHGGGWNLMDKYQRPGSCCDNVAMGDQIEHLRDFDLSSASREQPSEPPSHRLTSELCDLIVLMPDTQVDEILAFIAMLRDARKLRAESAASRDRKEEQENPMSENISTWYGPHGCRVCGVTIVKAAREDGGAEFEPPDRLMRAYRRGCEAFDVDLVYPMTWTPHVHAPTWQGIGPRPSTPAAAERPLSDASVLP